MEDRRYLDDKGLALYDEEIKEYIRRRIDVESLEIQEFFPEVEEQESETE